VLERGAFDRQATQDTAGALAFYAPSVVLISFNMLLKILLFLRRRTGPILLLGLAELSFNVALNAALVGSMGIRGLALATSVTTLLVTLTLPVYLARAGLLHPRPLLDCALRLIPGTLAAFVVCWRVALLGLEAGWIGAAAALGAGLIAGAALHALGARYLGAWAPRRGEAS
jgi:peptidoglycan biosynthesis protein MviN/MurJ (putative lipid II flippase)